MITQIDISNFRSIKQQSIPLKKLNILYGANGSGKSSVAYAPYVMRNFFANPNQRLNSLFNLGFINLGGIDNILNKEENNYGFEIGLTFSQFGDNYDSPSAFFRSELPIIYKIYFAKDNTATSSFVWNDQIAIDIDLPYNNFLHQEVNFDKIKTLWNGIFMTGIESHKSELKSQIFNEGIEEIKNIEVISVRRGFFNPIFSTEFTDDLESNFALTIRNEGIDFETKIDHYFKQIFNKTFRFVAIPGSTSFYLKTQNSKGLTTDLVNEGFGVNQTVYMLAKLLKKNTSLAFIEEPEIHLHPSAQAKLVDAFIDIVQKEDKQIFLSTHSENIVSTVLAKIATGELNKDDVQFYLAKFEDGETKIIPQEVNDKGQVEGGLMSFMETELSNLKAMLGI